MRLVFKNIKDTPLNLMRKAGYSFVRRDEQTGEESFFRRAGDGEYPKFHVYIKKEGESAVLNLHLDQKKSSYKGSFAHGAEYEDSEILEKEAETIKKIFSD